MAQALHSPAVTRLRTLAWLHRGATMLWRDARRTPAVYLICAQVLLLIFGIAAARVFGPVHLPMRYMLNWTPSIPFLLFRRDPAPVVVERGMYVVYPANGPGVREFPGIRDQPLVKRVAGVSGDVVTVVEREVFVNGDSVGVAKARSKTRVRLEPINPGVIPPGYVYVHGTSPDSFDSRYTASGLVPLSSITAFVTPVF